MGATQSVFRSSADESPIVLEVTGDGLFSVEHETEALVYGPPTDASSFGRDGVERLERGALFAVTEIDECEMPFKESIFRVRARRIGSEGDGKPLNLSRLLPDPREGLSCGGLLRPADPYTLRRTT